MVAPMGLNSIISWIIVPPPFLRRPLPGTWLISASSSELPRLSESLESSELSELLDAANLHLSNHASCSDGRLTFLAFGLSIQVFWFANLRAGMNAAFAKCFVVHYYALIDLGHHG
jgi:hypothetical protein